ncbi:MAG: class I SAM-dependent methyltransferase, partial [Actinomycetota bacterium]
EALAAGYRHRRVTPDSLERAGAAADAAGLGPGKVAIDVGGGRGIEAGVFAGRGALALVIDRSEAMAAAARLVPGVSAVVGDAGRLPLADRCADLVHFQLSIHYGDWRRSLGEAVRVCREGGTVWVWTLSREHLRSSFLTEWFPSVAPIDAARFPDPADLARFMSEAGLVEIVETDARERVERTAGEWREAVEAGFVSTLQLLPPGELAAGLQRFGSAHPDLDQTIAYDLEYRSVSGSVRIGEAAAATLGVQIPIPGSEDGDGRDDPQQ